MAKNNKQKNSVKETKSTTSVEVIAAPRASTVSSRNEFNPDYTYVKQDLRRIGTLAGIFIVALIVLSFFI
jgi:hypothetical protein